MPDTKVYMLYDSIYTKCSKEENPERQKEELWVYRAGGLNREKGWEGGEHRE